MNAFPNSLYPVQFVSVGSCRRWPDYGCGARQEGHGGHTVLLDVTRASVCKVTIPLHAHTANILAGPTRHQSVKVGLILIFQPVCFILTTNYKL